MTADTLPGPSLPISSPDLDSDDDLVAWRGLFGTVFALPPADPQELDAARETYRSQRLTGVRDDGRWVATFRSWTHDSAVPGSRLTGLGAGTDGPDGTRTLSTELVSTVAVSPTHRRRGLLSRLMADCLDHAAQQGTVVASLFASEAAIYGRFGYGVATRVQDLTVDTRAARTWHAAAPVSPGRVRLSDDDEIAAVGPALFESARRAMPGAVARNDIAWRRLLERMPGSKVDGPRLRAVHADPDGRVDGYLRARTEMAWTDGQPRYTTKVEDLVGADPAVVAALWRFCLDLDLVTTVKAEGRGHGEPLLELPLDTRAVQVASLADGHWWRVLDAPAALGARSWSAPGSLVLEVVDPGGPAAGRWSLDVDEDGQATLTSSARAADVTLPVQTLPAVLTGLRPLPVLHAAGRLDEHSPGAVRRLASMASVQPVSLGTVQGF